MGGLLLTGAAFQGWRTCAQLQYVNASLNEMAPHFPLTGPTKIALYVEKTDITMEGYKLDWRISDSQVMPHHYTVSR